MARPKSGNLSAWLRGGQTVGHTLDMIGEVVRRLFVFVLLWGALCVFILGSVTTPEQETYGVLATEARILEWIGPPLPQKMALHDPAMGRHTYPVHDIPNIPWLKPDADFYYRKVFLTFILWACGSLLLLLITTYWYTGYGKKKLAEQQVRGQQVARVGDLIAQIEAHNAEQRVAKNRPNHVAARLLNVPYPFGTETEHTLLAAAPGSGKTVALHDLLTSIRARGDRAVVYDPDLAFIAHHYDPDTDVILNCFDDRSVAWTPFADAKESHEWAKLAESLYKDPKSGDAYWTSVTRQVFTWTGTVLSRRDTGCTLAELLEVMFGPLERLRRILAETPVAEHLADGSPGRVSSLRSVMIEGVIPLLYLIGREGDFSIRKWVNHPEQRPGFLFLSAPETHMATLRPMLGFWADIVVSAILNRRAEGVPSIPTWVILEEFVSLGRLDSLADAPQRIRQYGGAIVICIQQVSQLEDIYGREKARTIIGQCATRLILRANDYGTAQFLSEMLGRRVMHRVVENTSYGAHSIRDGVGIAPREEMEAIWLPEDIMNWPALQGAIAVPNARASGAFPVAPIKFEYVDRPVVAPGWLPRTGPDPVTTFLARHQLPAPATPASEVAGEGGTQLVATDKPSDDPQAVSNVDLEPGAGDTPTERDADIVQRRSLDEEFRREQERERAAQLARDPAVPSDKDSPAMVDPGVAADLGLDTFLTDMER